MNTAATNEMERLRQERDALQQQLDAALEREAALAAQALELKECISDDNEMLGELRKIWQKKMPKSAQDVQDQIHRGEEIIIEKTSSALNRRDLIKQAEALESKVLRRLLGMVEDSGDPVMWDQAEAVMAYQQDLRQRAQELTP